MVIFHSYVKLPEGITYDFQWGFLMVHQKFSAFAGPSVPLRSRPCATVANRPPGWSAGAAAPIKHGAFNQHWIRRSRDMIRYNLITVMYQWSISDSSVIHQWCISDISGNRSFTALASAKICRRTHGFSMFPSSTSRNQPTWQRWLNHRLTLSVPTMGCSVSP